MKIKFNTKQSVQTPNFYVQLELIVSAHFINIFTDTLTVMKIKQSENNGEFNYWTPLD